jgi:thiamine-phosphate pyrophosphorylase
LLYLISDRLALRRIPGKTEPEAAQIEAIRKATRAGCQLVQIREKDLNARDIVNDRLDVALAAGADGVHLRATSFPASEARAVVGSKGLNDFIIGVSTHSLAEARSAESGGADFIVCGPLYNTPSKRAYGAPIGIENFAEICRSVEIPVLALGGIDLTNYQEPLRRGAAGIAAIRLFADPERLECNIETILNA